MQESNLSWLTELERSVERAAERLSELRAENSRLAVRVAELEGAAPPPVVTGEDPAAAAWQGERTEVRGRVEALAESLEALLADDG